MSDHRVYVGSVSPPVEKSNIATATGLDADTGEAITFVGAHRPLWDLAFAFYTYTMDNNVAESDDAELVLNAPTVMVPEWSIIGWKAAA